MRPCPLGAHGLKINSHCGCAGGVTGEGPLRVEIGKCPQGPGTAAECTVKVKGQSASRGGRAWALGGHPREREPPEERQGRVWGPANGRAGVKDWIDQGSAGREGAQMREGWGGEPSPSLPSPAASAQSGQPSHKHSLPANSGPAWVQM